MQMNFLFILALFVAAENGVEISTWIWVVAWSLTILRGCAILIKEGKK